MKTWWLRWLGLGLALWMSLAAAHALTPADALALVDGDTDVRIDTLNKLAAEPDEKASALIKAMAEEAVRLQGERVFIVVDDGAVDAVTGEKLPLPDDAKPKDPVSENMAALKGEPIKAFQNQNHEAHIQVHRPQPSLCLR